VRDNCLHGPHWPSPTAISTQSRQTVLMMAERMPPL